jgi:hypothetical protein
LLLLLSAALAGCASGPKYAEIKNTIPALQPEMGRIYFYRSSALGAALKPDIRLNGQVVGEMVPLGFFYVDRQPGSYLASATTEVEATLKIPLEANQTRYVRGYITMGLYLGRPGMELVSATEALQEMQDLAHTGASAQGTSATASGAAPAAAGATSSTGTSTNRNDLEGLLPGTEGGKK